MDITSLKITPEILALVSEIDEFKGSWQLLGRLTPERLRELKKVATIESVGSSTRIEGAKLSDHEVEILLSQLNKKSFRTRDEQEVAGYAYVCEEIFSNFAVMSFTENVIKQLHIWLLRYSTKDEFHRGEYKKIANHIEAFDMDGRSLGVIFETTAPFETPWRMQELIYWTRDYLERKSLHPLLVIALFIVTFLAIHPFQDGNGRLSRCLTTLLLLQSGYAYVSYCSLESIIEENKESYYVALRRTQQSMKDNVDFNPWIIFFLRSLQKQKQILEQKVSKEKILHLHLSPLSERIILLIGEQGRLSISELEILTQANRNTLKKHLQELVAANHLLRHGKARATWYTLS